MIKFAASRQIFNGPSLKIFFDSFLLKFIDTTVEQSVLSSIADLVISLNIFYLINSIHEYKQEAKKKKNLSELFLSD